jgi:hypothetical protein
MPKRHQNRQAKEQVGRNNPKKSTIITTGTPRKKVTMLKEAQEHKDTSKTPQEAKVPATIDPTEGRSKKADSQVMAEQREKRSGSDSHANKHRKTSKIHDSNKAIKQPTSTPEMNDDFTDDLRPDNLAGEDHGQGLSLEYGLSAYDVKELHNKLADLTDDELKDVPIVPIGSRLEQGAKYIDLRHLEWAEFVATAGMVAEESHYYVPKKASAYILWNRLNQVSIPARVDEGIQ